MDRDDDDRIARQVEERAEAAAAGGLDPAAAVEAVDEVLDVVLPARPACLTGPTMTAHLHATDAAGEWMVTIGEGRHHLERAHGKGEVAVRAPAADLLLWLTGRCETDGEQFTVFGDETTLAEFARRVRQR